MVVELFGDSQFINTMANKNVLEFVREEDYVEYFVFPTMSTNDVKEHECILNNLLKKIQKEILDKYCKDYIWHRDDFKLVPRTRITNLLAIENEDTGKQMIKIVKYNIIIYL